MEKPNFLFIKAPSGDIATINQSLGLAYLAAVLEKESIPVQILDSPVFNWKPKDLIAKVKKIKPRFIGLTATTEEFDLVLKLAKNLKKHFPKIIIIIGGPHVTVTALQTMKHRCFDIAVIGEGEKTIVKLAEMLIRGKTNFKKIKGLAFRQNGKVYLTPPRPYINNLNSIPFPARHLLPSLNKYRPTPGSYKNLPVGTILTSRGCPFHCTFCARNVFGNQIRFRDPENVVDEIEMLVKNYGAREIRIWDDTFNLKPERVVAICKGIIKRKLLITWTCQARVNFINRQMLLWMKKAGCWQIAYGIESGNQETLNRIKKGITLKMVERAVKATKNAGIEVKGFFMLGLPGDTERTMRETINFAKRLDLDLATFSITVPFPGTELFSLISRTDEFKKVSYRNYRPYEKTILPYVPKGLTTNTIISYQKKAYREFYFRPKIFIQEILKIRNLVLLRNKISGFFSIQPKIPN